MPDRAGVHLEEISGVVAGARNTWRMKSYIGDLASKFSPEDEALMNSLVPAGNSLTSAYVDRTYPVEGREV